MLTANYYDGQHASGNTVELDWVDEALAISGDGIGKRYGLKELETTETYEHVPVRILFSDGGFCDIGNREAGLALLARLGFRPGPVTRMQAKWPFALVAMVLMALMLFAIKTWALPWFAEKAAPWVPASFERQLGEATLDAIDQGGLFTASSFSDSRIAQIREAFTRLEPTAQQVPLRLELRNSLVIGPNAFALPGTTIVLTDQMVRLAMGKNGGEWNEQSAQAIAGVLAHEIGHIRHRDPIKGLIGHSAVMILIGSVLGDASQVATIATTQLVNADYSRQAESSADDYAIALLKEKHMSTLPLAELFGVLETNAHNDKDDTPEWLRSAANYTSSHPATKERIAKFRAAAEQPR